MGKFKRGDRVRLTRDNMGFGNAGDAGEIVNPDSGWEDALVRFDSKINGAHEWFAPWSNLELVPVAEATGTVKDGDIVRCVEDYEGQFTEGKEYVVRRVYREGGITRISVVADDSGNKDNGWLACKFVPVKRTITIQSGKFYITRDGRKVGPMRRWSDEAKHRWEADDDDLPYIWADDGTEIDSDIDDGADLVAEAGEPPAEPQSTKEILDELEAWIAEQDAIEADGKGSTAGFTVPVFDEDDFDICGHRDSDDDIVQLSVGELTAALADSLKVARKVERPASIKPEAPVASIADIVRRLERLEAATLVDESATFRIGDKVTLRATVTGKQKKNRMNITLDDVSGAAHSIVVPAAALTAA